MGCSSFAFAQRLLLLSQSFFSPLTRTHHYCNTTLLSLPPFEQGKERTHTEKSKDNNHHTAQAIFHKKNTIRWSFRKPTNSHSSQPDMSTVPSVLRPPLKSRSDMTLAGRHTAASSGSTVALSAPGRYNFIHSLVERASVLHPAYSTHSRCFLCLLCAFLGYLLFQTAS